MRIEYYQDMLDNGFYVAFSGVDDFYIEGKSWYKEQHFNHDGLIIGYNDENKTFSIVAHRWIFTAFETSQACFVEAMTVLCDKRLVWWSSRGKGRR